MITRRGWLAAVADATASQLGLAALTALAYAALHLARCQTSDPSLCLPVVAWVCHHGQDGRARQ